MVVVVGGWLPTHFKVSLQLQLRLSWAVTIKHAFYKLWIKHMNLAFVMSGIVLQSYHTIMHLAHTYNIRGRTLSPIQHCKSQIINLGQPRKEIFAHTDGGPRYFQLSLNFRKYATAWINGIHASHTN